MKLRIIIGNYGGIVANFACCFLHAAYHPHRWWSMPDKRRSRFSTVNNVFRPFPRAVWECATRTFNVSLIQDCGSLGATSKAVDPALVVTGEGSGTLHTLASSIVS